MKLRGQLFIAFLAMILISMGATLLFTYHSIQYLMVSDQHRTLREQALKWIVPIANNGISDHEWQQLVSKAHAANAEVFVITTKLTVIRSSLQGKETISSLPHALDRGIWQLGQQSVIGTALPVYEHKTLYYVVATVPLRVWALSGRIALEVVKIFLLSSIFSLVISLFFSERLAAPLRNLLAELKKVEKRQFSKVVQVKASGEIGDVATGVFHLSQEISGYIQTQRTFIQNGSHELKTPLMSIQGYAEAIRDGVFTGEEANHGLDVIIKESKRLKKIVTDMVLLAKLESEDGIYDLEVVDIQAVVLRALATFKPLFATSNISVDVTRLENLNERLVIADEEKLLQALINILSNALRYAKRRITVTLSSFKQQVRVTVQDDGHGFSEDLLPQIFHRFVMGDDGETGLGLAIARAIVEQCDGQIGARNADGGGAVVWISLPVSPVMQLDS